MTSFQIGLLFVGLGTAIRHLVSIREYWAPDLWFIDNLLPIVMMIYGTVLILGG